jgi:hypothetical protein
MPRDTFRHRYRRLIGTRRLTYLSALRITSRTYTRRCITCRTDTRGTARPGTRRCYAGGATDIARWQRCDRGRRGCRRAASGPRGRRDKTCRARVIGGRAVFWTQGQCGCRIQRWRDGKALRQPARWGGPCSGGRRPSAGGCGGYPLCSTSAIRIVVAQSSGKIWLSTKPSPSEVRIITRFLIRPPWVTVIIGSLPGAGSVAIASRIRMVPIDDVQTV